VIGLDTNVLLRYFTADDAAQSQAAARLIEKSLHAEHPGHVCLVALAELVWVLRTHFDADRREIVRVVTQLLVGEQFSVQDAAAVWMAVHTFDQLNIDFADALIAALNHQQGCSHTVTFDQRATRIPGVQLLT
jgi:predicted nucleic-acid-binding protein